MDEPVALSISGRRGSGSRPRRESICPRHAAIGGGKRPDLGTPFHSPGTYHSPLTPPSPSPSPGVAQTTCSSGRRQPQEAEGHASDEAPRSRAAAGAGAGAHLPSSSLRLRALGYRNPARACLLRWQAPDGTPPGIPAASHSASGWIRIHVIHFPATRRGRMGRSGPRVADDITSARQGRGHSFRGRHTSSLLDKRPVQGYHDVMPRLARVVVPGIAHHTTQRANRRQEARAQATQARSQACLCVPHADRPRARREPGPAASPKRKQVWRPRNAALNRAVKSPADTL